MNISKLIEKLEAVKVRSAWSKGVKSYAIDLCENLRDYEEWEVINDLRGCLLNGASDWSAYSWGGCALVYDRDIAKNLCNASEFKRFEAGKLVKPNKKEEWLDTQARALSQAYIMIKEVL